MVLELSESTCEIRVLSLAEVLVSEEQDLEFDESGFEFSQKGWVRGFREIDAPNFGPQTGALEPGFEMIEVECIESLTPTRNMPARSVVHSAFDLHSEASTMGPQRTADRQ
jgi:hypothetical protein